MLLANLEILQYRSHTSTISQGLQVHKYSTYMITYQILIHRHSFITSRRTMEEVLTSDGVCHPLDDRLWCTYVCIYFCSAALLFICFFILTASYMLITSNSSPLFLPPLFYIIIIWHIYNTFFYYYYWPLLYILIVQRRRNILLLLLLLQMIKKYIDYNY